METVGLRMLNRNFRDCS